MNVPVGVIVLVITPLIIPDLRRAGGTGSTSAASCWPASDCWGSAMGWSRGRSTTGARSPGSSRIPLILGLAVVLLLVFLSGAEGHPGQEPLIPFALFRDRNYTLMNWLSGLLSIGMLGISCR